MKKSPTCEWKIAGYKSNFNSGKIVNFAID